MSGWRRPPAIEKAASKGGRRWNLALGRRERNDRNAHDEAALNIGKFNSPREVPMRSVLLFLIGVPVPVILLLALCTHHF